MARIVQDQNARQGQKGRPVLMVLIGGLFLVVIYLVGMLVWSGLTSPDSPTQEASRTAVTGSPSGAANPTDRTPPRQSGLPAAGRSDDRHHDAQAITTPVMCCGVRLHLRISDRQHCSEQCVAVAIRPARLCGGTGKIVEGIGGG